METTVTVNQNYYGEAPLFDANLKTAFGQSATKVRKELFSNVYELTTRSKGFEQLQLFGFKQKPNKLEEEERLILKLYSKEETKGRAYYIQTGLYAGVVFHKGYKFNIKSKYGPVFFNRMLNFLNDIYVTDELSPASKKQEVNEFQYIIAHLFLQSLEKAAVLGLPKEYQSQSQRGPKVRGKIDINAYLKLELPFKGKLTTTFREQQLIQPIVDVLYHALKRLEKLFGRDIGRSLLGLSQLLKQHQSGKYPSQETIAQAKNHRSLHNPMFSAFKKVLEYAEVILLNYDLSPSNSSNNLTTTGFLFDISELFEIYLEKLLRQNFKDWYIDAQTELRLYKGLFYGRKMMPDLLMRHKESGKVVVFDAKFKTMRLIKDDLDRSDFYQIHSYIQYYESDIVLGGLLYPLSEPIDTARAHAVGLFGDPSRQHTRFIVDGIYLDKGMDMSAILEQELAFVNRISHLLEEFVC